jgi:hypothetical protein
MKNVAHLRVTAIDERAPGQLLFQRVVMMSSAICIVLSIVWIAAPLILLSLWQVQFTYESGLIARRGGALFLGIGVAFFAARDAQPSPLRSALLRSACLSCVVLALLGGIEFMTGHAGAGILSAVAVEMGMAASLAWASRKGVDRDSCRRD